MTEIQLFEVEGSRWRFGQDEAGRPWVVAVDVARALDYRDADKATRLLDGEEKGTQIVGTPGGPQQMAVIYEDGIWELIFRSSKPEAKPIKKRVKAILREIRETGSYGVASMTPAEFLVYQAQQLLAQERRVRQLGHEVAEVTARVDSIEHNSEMVTVLAFRKLHRVSPPLADSQMAGIGTRCTNKFRNHFGAKPPQARDQRYGTVGLYPEWMIREALEDAGYHVEGP